MCITDTIVLAQGLERLREINALLDDSEAGVCLIHLEACIAALESRIDALNAVPALSDTPAVYPACELGRPLPEVLR